MGLAWLIHHWAEYDTSSGAAVSPTQGSLCGSGPCCCPLGQASSVTFSLGMGDCQCCSQLRSNCPCDKSHSPQTASSMGQIWISGCPFCKQTRLWDWAALKSHLLLQQVMSGTFCILLFMKHQFLEPDAMSCLAGWLAGWKEGRKEGWMEWLVLRVVFGVTSAQINAYTQSD